MKLEKLNFGLPKLREDFPGKLNKWEIIGGANLKLVDYYPDFKNDIESALIELEKNNPISKAICGKIRTEINNRILSFKTYSRFSKWCDWNQKSSEILAKNISRILFGFDIPRMLDQQNRVTDEKIKENFLSKLTEEEDAPKDKVDIELDSAPGEVTESKEKPEEISQRYEEYIRENRIEFITFHPSYSYEEFIEGITVEIEGEKEAREEIKYKLRPGIFKDLCKRALGAAIGLSKEEIENKLWIDIYKAYRENVANVDFDAAPKHVLIIDEINRGDMAKIFGELITLIEADKRIGAENEFIAKLPTSGDPFGVPKNIYIIATMNTADRSIALLDVALRRRFGFIEMNPNFEVLKKEHLDKNESKLKENGVYDLLKSSVDAIKSINKKICDDKTIGRDKQIGHSFFFKVESINDLIIVWKHEILPLLEEYCYSDYTKINRILFEKDSDTEYISESEGIREINKDNIQEMLSSIVKT